MFHGLRYVRQAIAALAGADGHPPERAALEQAFARLQPAMMFEGTWPPEVRAMAERIHAAFFRYGPAGATVRRMTDQEARSTLSLLQAFANEAERIADEERIGHSARSGFVREPQGRARTGAHRR